MPGRKSGPTSAATIGAALLLACPTSPPPAGTANETEGSTGALIQGGSTGDGRPASESTSTTARASSSGAAGAGDCAAPCVIDHGAALCVDGDCRVESCEASYGDCNGIYEDGCESSLGAPPSIPEPRSPSTGSEVGRQPTLAWHPSVSTCGEPEYELVVDDGCEPGSLASCSFASPEVEVRTREHRHALPGALPAAATPPVGARYAWRVRACDAGDRCSPWSTVWYLHVDRSRQDLDGDGYDDFAIATTLATHALWRGGPSIAETPQGSITGLGLQYAGDVDGDGFGDVIGMADYEPTAGYVPRVFFGGPDLSDLRTVDLLSAAGTPSTIHYVGGAGDLEGDGFADLAVVRQHGGEESELLIYRGAPVLTETVAAHRRAGLDTDIPVYGAPAGGHDISGDGYPDVVVARYPSTNERTEFRVLAGGPGFDGEIDQIAMPRCEPPGPRSVGDLDGDGIGDLLLVCGPGDRASVDVLRGQLLPLTSTGYATFLPHVEAAAAADFDRDGFQDLLLGLAFEDAAAGPYLWSGGPEFNFLTQESDLPRIAALPVSGRLVAGDHDGDGIPDAVAVGYEAGGAVEAYWARGRGDGAFIAMPLSPGEVADGFGRALLGHP